MAPPQSTQNGLRLKEGTGMVLELATEVGEYQSAGFGPGAFATRDWPPQLSADTEPLAIPKFQILRVLKMLQNFTNVD